MEDVDYIDSFLDTKWKCFSKTQIGVNFRTSTYPLQSNVDFSKPRSFKELGKNNNNDDADDVPLTELFDYAEILETTRKLLKRLNPNSNFIVTDIQKWNQDEIDKNYEIDSASESDD